MMASIDLPEPIFKALKTLAEQRGSSVQAVILEVLEKDLVPSPVPNNAGDRVRLPLLHSIQPGVLRSLTGAEIDAILD